jgi:hypothetical protein
MCEAHVLHNSYDLKHSFEDLSGDPETMHDALPLAGHFNDILHYLRAKLKPLMMDLNTINERMWSRGHTRAILTIAVNSLFVFLRTPSVKQKIRAVRAIRIDVEDEPLTSPRTKSLSSS